MANPIVATRAKILAPFPSVDAALFQWMDEQFKSHPARLHLEYTQLTSGSSFLTLLTDSRQMFLSIMAQSINNEETMLLIAGFADNTTNENLQEVLGMFSYYWQQEQKRYQSLPLIDNLPRPAKFPVPLPEAPKRGPGAPPDPDNEWARREIAAGRGYDSTLMEWMQRRNVDLKDPRAVSQARDLFRKTVAKRTGRK